MSQDRLSDCRPPLRDPSFANASAHPELLCGYLAERPHCRPMPEEFSISGSWARRTIAITVVAIVAVLVLFKDYPHAAPAPVQVQAAPAADCAAWHATAGDALAGLVHAKMDLTQVSDVIARLRRARRTCELGSIALACRDYQTIIAMAPRKLAGPAGPPWECPAVDGS